MLLLILLFLGSVTSQTIDYYDTEGWKKFSSPDGICCYDPKVECICKNVELTTLDRDGGFLYFNTTNHVGYDVKFVWSTNCDVDTMINITVNGISDMNYVYLCDKSLRTITFTINSNSTVVIFSYTEKSRYELPCMYGMSSSSCSDKIGYLQILDDTNDENEGVSGLEYMAILFVICLGGASLFICMLVLFACGQAYSERSDERKPLLPQYSS